MSLGFDAIAALPFATSGPDTDVTINVSGNTLTIGIGIQQFQQILLLKYLIQIGLH